MAAKSDFKVDRSLIDANFEGYKLSLDTLPSYKSHLDNGWHRKLNGLAGRSNLQFYILMPLLRREGDLVGLQIQQVTESQTLRRHTAKSKRIHSKLTELWEAYDEQTVSTSSFVRRVGISVAELSENQYSYHHVKLFGVQNHLVLDPWFPSSVYLVDKTWNVVKATAFDMSLECGEVVMTVPDRSNQILVPGRHNISIKFVTVDLAVVSDGAGQLHLVDTGNRAEGNHKWKIVLTKTVPGETTPCFLVDAVQLSDEENHRLECLMVHVSESTVDEKDKYRSQYLTNLDWLTFSSVDRKYWSLDRNRKLVGRRPFHYAALDKGEPAVVIAAEADFVFTYDSEIPVVEEVEKTLKTKDSTLPEYTWYQTGEDVTVQFTIPEAVTKADIYLTLITDHLDIGLKNTRSLLKGQLTNRVDVDASTWTIDGQKLELTLCKLDEGVMWPLVVEGDTRGEMVVDPSEASLIHEKLVHLTSEEWNPEPNVPNKPYNSEELEECDDTNTDNFILARWHGNTHKCTHTSNLGSHQWLFNIETESNKPPCLCIRHDVDGLLWQPHSSPKDNSPAWTHVATLNAFGYVQASKQTKKFSACPPDFSYAIIADEARHIYVYRQSSPVNTPLRNRKTGKDVKTVAKQHVVSLDNVDIVLGLQATNEKLFVLTEKTLFAFNVKVS